MKALFVFLSLIGIVCSGCSKGSKAITIGPQGLELGMQMLFMIIETDSVVSANLKERRKHVQKAVYFSVVDTTNGFNIEWNEQHLLDRLDTTGISGPIQEWVPYCRVLYHVDRQGTIDRVLNYDEIRSTIDPLIDLYIEQTGLAEAPRIDDMLAPFLDSSWVVSRLLTNAELLHRLYGTTFTPGDTTHLFAYTPYTTPTLAECSFVLRPSPMCTNSMGISGWSAPFTVELNRAIPDALQDLESLRDLHLPNATASERMEVCFDLRRAIVTYLDFERRIQMDTIHMVQNVLIFEQE